MKKIDVDREGNHALEKKMRETSTAGVHHMRLFQSHSLYH